MNDSKDLERSNSGRQYSPKGGRQTSLDARKELGMLLARNHNFTNNAGLKTVGEIAC
jgi:hypothetical protein